MPDLDIAIFRSQLIEKLLSISLIVCVVCLESAPSATGENVRSCYEDCEVTVESTAPGIRLAGTLSLQVGTGPFPAVLMITGNGPHTRDQMISNSPTFRMIADHFARRGMIVLRTDARGYGASTGPKDWEQYTTLDRVEDNRAVLNFLRSQDGVDPERIVLFGHSEGAMIASALAASGANPALTILIAPSALQGNFVFSKQRAEGLRQQGATDDIVEAVYQQYLRFAEFLAEGNYDSTTFEAIALDFLAAHGVPEDELDPVFARSLLQGYLVAPWFKYFVSYDPREDLRRIKSPVLALFAGDDENVPWAEHAPELINSLAEAANDDFAAIVLPDQDHFFLEYKGKRLVKHRPGEMVIAEELFAALDAELSRRELIGDACTR